MAEGDGVYCVGCGNVRAFSEPPCTCRARPDRLEDSNAFVAARLLRALAHAREDTLVQCDEWDALAKGEFPLTLRIRELLCLCEPGAPAHEHSKGGYR